MEFKTKDSGARQVFHSGAQRDTQVGKPRPDLIPLPVLDALQQAFGGSPLDADGSEPPIWYYCDEDEVRRDLIPDVMLNRLGGLYHRGAIKYGDNNYQKGIPLDRIYASLFRHLLQWYAGDASEDHLAAIIWNASTLMWTEREMSLGNLPESLATAGPLAHEVNIFDK
jgi:hypothetical protein